MKNKLHLVQKTVSLTCYWAPTGDPKMPFTCTWVGSKIAQSVSSATSAEESGRMHLCA